MRGILIAAGFGRLVKTWWQKPEKNKRGKDKDMSGNILKDGIQAVNIIRGRRTDGHVNDKELIALFKITWRIDSKKLISILKAKNALIYE